MESGANASAVPSTREAGRVQRARIELYLAAPQFKFYYFIPHNDHELSEVSPFQGFSRGLAETVHLFRYVPHFPADIRELISGTRHIAAFRSLGTLWYNVLPIQLGAFSDALRIVAPVLTCVISNRATYEAAEAVIGTYRYPVLHLSTEKTATTVPVASANDATFREYVSRVAMAVGKVDSDFGTWLAEILLEKKSRTSALLNLARSHHNVTVPNEVALQSVGLKLKEGFPLAARGGSERSYIAAICKSADFVRRYRIDALKRLGNTSEPHVAVNCILATPGYYRFTKHDLGKSKRPHRALAKAVRLVKGYEGYVIRLRDADAQLMQSPFWREVVSVRAREMRLFTEALAIRAASQFAPVFRLPQLPREMQWQLNRISGCARSKSPNRAFKLNLLVRQFKEQMSSYVPVDIINRLTQFHGDVKVVSDWPLEWLQLDGMPLQFRLDTSRIPTTPGSMLFSGLIETQQIRLSSADLNDVLVLRSLGESDPIRDVLAKALAYDASAAGPSLLRARIVDVSTEEELVRALNAYTGPIVIFDCHGACNPDSGIGTLVVGGGQLDPWKLRGKARIPPIVFLSACDTHSLAGSHASVANGMLAIGAATVVGTLLPIDALAASVYLARLMLRLREFLPIWIKRRSLKWSHFIAGMQRMTYVTDILWSLVNARMLSDGNTFSEIQLEINNLINPYHPDWFMRLKRLLAQRVGQARLERHLETKCQLLECMKYVQLGNPERILIMSEAATALSGERVSSPIS